MPDPIRTGLILPPTLLDDDTVQLHSPDEVNKLECTGVDEGQREVVQEPVQVTYCFESQQDEDTHSGPISFKWDPYGRDMPRRNCEVKSEWSVEPLAKHLKKVVSQIESNIETDRIPSAEKLDAFVQRLVANTQRLLKHAPRKMRTTLQSLFTCRFKRFWNFARNEKVRSTTPEELKGMLTALIDTLVSEFGVRSDAVQELSRLHAQHHHRNHRPQAVDPCGRS